MVDDFNGDAREDVFLAQNFFAYQSQTTRSDAGRGLLLEGDGLGGFRPVRAVESGLRILGEQRGAATADYDADGRPGLRVRLSGPPGNPDGIGAVLRVRRAGTGGPARAVNGGSGWWSLDGAIAVLAADGATGLEVLWPGGRRVAYALPAGTRAVTVNPAGEIRPLP